MKYPTSSSLDHALALMLKEMRVSGAPALHTVAPDHARRGYAKMTRALNGTTAVDATTATDWSVGAEQVPVRIYQPRDREGDEPVVVYLHGGGWVIGDLATHAQIARDICRYARATVVAVDYRRSPESPHPAALEDVIAVVCWLTQPESPLGETSALALVGDSAGANLAISSLVGEPGLRHYVDDLLLAYPLVQHVSRTASRAQLAEGYMLETATVEWFSRLYAGDMSVEELDVLPTANPLNANLEALPPTRIVVAGFDVLRDEGILLAERCRRFGIAITLVEEPAMLHGFLELGGISAAAAAITRRELMLLGDRLRQGRKTRSAAGSTSAQ